MKVNTPNDKQVIQQALQILRTHMTPSKFARFIAACNLGEGDYLKTKEQLFVNETVDSLSEKIQAFETIKNQQTL
jgi:hypothetical protein